MTTQQRARVPVNEPLLDDAARANVMRCMEEGWISSEGAFVQEFERRWADYCGVEHGIAVCNGTVALELALASVGLEPGDEVIMPSFTIISCALAVIEAGATPVLVDCDPLTWCMDVEQVAARIGPKTRAIMPVHIYGHPVDMDAILELARRAGAIVIEDAAEAHGAEYRGRRVGGIGDVSCFSFYANKIISTGEGGMVLTRDAKIADKARAGRNLAFDPKRRFLHSELGHNYRLTNLQAAIGVAQVDAIGEHLSRKRSMAAYYQEKLAGVGGVQLPIEMPWAMNVYWMYGIVLDEALGMDAAAMAAKMSAHGIETRPFFVGMHEQPALRRLGLFEAERYPVTERIARQGLYLPSGLTLTRQQQDLVCEAVHAILPT